MNSKYDFDSVFEDENLNNDRNVLNKSDDDALPGLVFNDSKGSFIKGKTSVVEGGFSGVEFTDASTTFYEPLEDLDLISGRTKPSVVGSLNEPKDYSLEHKIYDPSKDATTGFGYVNLNSMNEKTGDKFTKESFGLPDFYTNPIDLIIASLILLALIVIEIIGLIAIL